MYQRYMNETKNSPPKPPCTNEEALTWLREGSFELENKAIGCLYPRLLGMIRPWIYSKNGTSEDAHDAVTAAVIKFVQNFREGKYHEQGKLEHYLFRIAQRKFYDLLRERGEEEPIEWSFPDGLSPEIEEEEDPEEKAEQEVEALARQKKLELCLGQIGERCKERIMRFWYMDQSHKEIAEAMGDASPDVSKAMKNKCQGKLEKCMKN